jgi:hypothetical protein
MLVVIGILIGVVAGLAVGVLVGSRVLMGRRQAAAQGEAERAVADATRAAEAIRREAQVEAREQALRLRAEVEQEVKEVIEGGINGEALVDIEAHLDKVEESDDPRVRATLEGIAANPTFRSVRATLKSVEVLDDAGCEASGVSAPCAQAAFDISLAGAVALPDYRGYVVQNDDKWQLSRLSLCDLVALDPSIPQCA